MKAAILVGGFGTRLSKETTLKLKPIIKVSGKPMFWHIMNIYASFEYKEFVIALGCKVEIVKDYFLNYSYYSHSHVVHLKTDETILHDYEGED